MVMINGYDYNRSRLYLSDIFMRLLNYCEKNINTFNMDSVKQCSQKRSGLMPKSLSGFLW